MSPPSPLLLSGSLTTFTIKVEETAIPSTLQVTLIETSIDVNRIPKARLTIYDGNPASGKFPASEADLFLPGKRLTIAAGYSQKNTLIFSGVIVSQSLEIDQTTSSRLIVEITDRAMAMTLSRKNAVYPSTTDSALMEQLITNNGLTASVAATTTVYEDIVQYYAADWDLLVMRAELNGMVVIVDGGNITVASPDTTAPPVLRVQYGDSILDLDAKMNAATQFASSAIQSLSWDDATQAMLQAGPGPVAVEEQGNVTSEQLSETFKVNPYTEQTAANIPSSSLQEWSSAELLRSKLSKIRGRVRFQGSALAKTGSMIQMAGLGARFNGPAYMSGVSHRIANGLWTTTAIFGLAWPWFSAEARNVPAPPTSGQLPPIQGLQTGKVKQVATDPAGEFRVEVTLPILGATSATVWARLGSFYASKGIGAVFYPEVNDEVIIAFMNNDPRYPVILGSVYSKPLPPPYPPDQPNNKKAIVTRSKLEMTFDDQNQVIEIKTPGKRTVRLDDTAGTITISDGDKNTVTLSSAGIVVDSGKDIVMKAAGSITIKANSGDLTMSASANATVDAKQLSLTATSGFNAHGGTASLTATGETTISGLMVKIN